MSAEAQIKSFIERIIRLKDEQDAIGEDIKAVYAEAKSLGFDKTGLGDVVTHLRKIEKKGADTIAEKEAIFDIYLSAYQGSQARASARTRENIEEFDAETGELSPKLAHTIVTGMQTEAGRAALVAAVDIMIEREEAEEQVPSSEQSEGNGSRDHQHVHSRQADGAERGRQDGQAAAPDHEGEATSNGLPANSEMDRAMEGSFETGSVAAENARKAIPDVGLMPQEDGDVTHAGAGEIPATIPEPDGGAISEVKGKARLENADGVEPPPSVTTPKPAPSMDELRIANALILRPNCKRPGQETCGGQGRTHCRDCTAAPVEREKEEA